MGGFANMPGGCCCDVWPFDFYAAPHKHESDADVLIGYTLVRCASHGPDVAGLITSEEAGWAVPVTHYDVRNKIWRTRAYYDETTKTTRVYYALSGASGGGTGDTLRRVEVIDDDGENPPTHVGTYTYDWGGFTGAMTGRNGELVIAAANDKVFFGGESAFPIQNGASIRRMNLLTGATDYNVTTPGIRRAADAIINHSAFHVQKLSHNGGKYAYLAKITLETTPPTYTYQGGFTGWELTTPGTVGDYTFEHGIGEWSESSGELIGSRTLSFTDETTMTATPVTVSGVIRRYSLLMKEWRCMSLDHYTVGGSPKFVAHLARMENTYEVAWRAPAGAPSIGTVANGTAVWNAVQPSTLGTHDDYILVPGGTNPTLSSTLWVAGGTRPADCEVRMVPSDAAATDDRWVVMWGPHSSYRNWVELRAGTSVVWGDQYLVAETADGTDNDDESQFELTDRFVYLTKAIETDATKRSFSVIDLVDGSERYIYQAQRASIGGDTTSSWESFNRGNNRTHFDDSVGPADENGYIYWQMWAIVRFTDDWNSGPIGGDTPAA